MSVPVRHKGNQIRIGVIGWPFGIQNGTNLVYDIDIARLILAADIIAASDMARGDDRQKRVCVVFDIKPIANVFPRALFHVSLKNPRSSPKRFGVMTFTSDNDIAAPFPKSAAFRLHIKRRNIQSFGLWS